MGTAGRIMGTAVVAIGTVEVATGAAATAFLLCIHAAIPPKMPKQELRQQQTALTIKSTRAHWPRDLAVWMLSGTHVASMLKVSMFSSAFRALTNSAMMSMSAQMPMPPSVSIFAMPQQQLPKKMRSSPRAPKPVSTMIMKMPLSLTLLLPSSAAASATSATSWPMWPLPDSPREALAIATAANTPAAMTVRRPIMAREGDGGLVSRFKWPNQTP